MGVGVSMVAAQAGFVVRFAPRAYAQEQSSYSFPNSRSFSDGTQTSVEVGRGDNQTVGLGGTTAPDQDRYQRTITIDNTANVSATTNTTYSFTLNTQALITGGKMQSDCGDIRFRDHDQTTDLRLLHIAGCNTTSTTVTVFVPSVTAAQTYTIFMYYGSPTHQASESIPLTNTSFTDAMTTAPPVGTFNNIATYDAVNQYARLTPAINGVNGELNYPLNPGSSFDATFQFWAGGGNGADSTYLYAYCDEVATQEDLTCNNGYIIAYDEYHAQYQVFYDGTLVAATPTSTVGNSTWHDAEIVKVGTRIKMYDNSALVLDYTDSARNISGDFFGLGGRTGGLNNEHRVRNFAVTHDYTAPGTAPGVAVGSESAVSPTYDALGTWESQQIDLGDVLDWGDGSSGSTAVQVAYALASANDTLQLEVRTGATNGDLSAASYQTIATLTSGSSLTLTKADLVGASLTPARFFQLRATLSQTDNTTPLLKSFTINTYRATPPDAPTSLTATGDYNTGVSLHWSAPANSNGDPVSSYNVYYKLHSSADWIGVANTASLTYNFAVGALRPSTAYDFKVTSINGSGEGPGTTTSLSTTSSPRLGISSCTDLQNMDNGDVFGEYYLTQNIDCSDTVNWNNNEGFMPIGSSLTGGYFKGTLDGNGFSIDHLYIFEITTCNQGLFSRLYDATVTNLTLNDVQMTGFSCNVGAVAGSAQGSSISYVTANGSVEGFAAEGLGGLVGDTDADGNGTPTGISNSSFTGDVINQFGPFNIGTGGLVGMSNVAVISNSYMNGDVEGNLQAGGLIGEINSSSHTTISNSYAAGSVGSCNEGGGLVGEESGAEILNSFATNIVGGRTGCGSGFGLGGLVGADFGSGATLPIITNDFYDQTLSGQADCFFTVSASVDCTAVNTSGSPAPNYFFGNSTSAPLDQWDFTHTWQTKTGDYPILRPAASHRTQPVIVLVGTSPYYVTQGSAFVDPGAIATDTDHSIQMQQIQQTGSVNTAVLGTYTITYTVSDNYGNAATPVTRTVIVVPPTASGSAKKAAATLTVPADTTTGEQTINLDDFADFVDGSGHQLTVKPGQIYTFTVTDAHGVTTTHTLTIGAIDFSNPNKPTITLTLQSTAQTFSLHVGQTVTRSVVGGPANIGLTANTISADQATLTVWHIAPPAATQNAATSVKPTASSSHTGWWYALVGAVLVGGLVWFLRSRRRSVE